MSSSQPSKAASLPNFRRALEAYERGENVTEFLQRELNTNGNTPAIIEMAYDLQAGSYIEWDRRNRELARRCTAEIAEVLDTHLHHGDRVLDVGTGELTTFTDVALQLKTEVRSLWAFDLSWSRIHLGRAFAEEMLSPALFGRLNAFVAEIGAVPLRSKSIDVTTSYHALEPNGGRERDILAELFRITRRKLILFEPSYANNSESGRARMTRLGYISDLDEHARQMGATVLEVLAVKHVQNPENLTYAYVIVPPSAATGSSDQKMIFSDPGEDEPLVRLKTCLYSPNLGVSYPIIEGIPVLRTASAVLTSALSKGSANS